MRADYAYTGTLCVIKKKKFLQVKSIALLILSFFFITCQIKNTSSQNKESVKPTEQKAPIEYGIEINSEILNQIKDETGKQGEKLKREIWKYYRDKEEEKYVLEKGVIFKFIKENKAHEIFNKFHDKLFKNGNYLFLTNLDFDDSYDTYYDVVIIRCSDQFELISLIGTDGVNYDLYNDDIVKQLKDWHKKVGFKIETVDGARIHAYMENLPSDLNQFTKDVYKFCPDVIDQGYGSMEEMIKDYKESKYFWLWWD